MATAEPRPFAHDPDLLDRCPYWSDREKLKRWQPPGGHAVAETRAAATCWWCQRARRRMRESHRARPPLPTPEPGCCRLCGGELTGRQRSWCSEACGRLWMGAANSPLMLAHLVELHGWTCWACGSDESFGALDVDHVRPLYSLGPEEREQPRWWLPFNLQLLCHACHKAKSAAEAGARARARA